MNYAMTKAINILFTIKQRCKMNIRKKRSFIKLKRGYQKMAKAKDAMMFCSIIISRHIIRIIFIHPMGLDCCVVL